MFYSCFSEKHVYRGCQSTNEPEASEGESSRTGNSRLNPNSHKRQIVVSNVTKYLLKCHSRVLIIRARRQFPPGAHVAGSLIYIKTKWMVGYAVSGWISPT